MSKKKKFEFILQRLLQIDFNFYKENVKKGNCFQERYKNDLRLNFNQRTRFGGVGLNGSKK